MRRGRGAWLIPPIIATSAGLAPLDAAAEDPSVDGASVDGGAASGAAAPIDQSAADPRCLNCGDQPERWPGATAYIFAQTGGRPLRLQVFAPAGGGPHPAIMFFFGGGFRKGSYRQFDAHARAFAAQGYVAILADYRVWCRDHVAPNAGAEDARAALAWLHARTPDLHVDPRRIILSGGSAGGLLATSAAMLAAPGARPCGLILFNPALDLRQAAGQFGLAAAQAAAISPAALPLSSLPPTLILHGKDDAIVPVDSVRDFCQAAREAGRDCTLVEYGGQAHGFFNSRQTVPSLDASPFEDTLKRAMVFAASITGPN